MRDLCDERRRHRGEVVGGGGECAEDEEEEGEREILWQAFKEDAVGNFWANKRQIR